jgi:predicted nucleic acid-binding protein
VSLLLDASVWLAAADRDDAYHEAAHGLVSAKQAQHAALDLTIYEVGNVAARRWSDPERARRLCLLVLTVCAERLVRLGADLAEEAVRVADREQITVYDAAYVAAARREGHVLVSGDLADLVDRGLALAPDAAAP